ncbi:MAG: hypothetical protein AAB606_02590, partial [Patescibacteria group bacterium]
IRPCPFVGCQFNLYLDINPRNGHIKLNFPDIEPDEMPAHLSCTLDVVGAMPANTYMHDASGRISLEEVGAILNLTRERSRQVVMEATLKLAAAFGHQLPEDFPPEVVADAIARIEDEKDERRARRAAIKAKRSGTAKQTP